MQTITLGWPMVPDRGQLPAAGVHGFAYGGSAMSASPVCIGGLRIVGAFGCAVLLGGRQYSVIFVPSGLGEAIASY